MKWKSIESTLISSNSQMLEVEIYRVGKGPVRMSKMEWK